MSEVYVSKSESLKVVDTYYVFDGEVDQASDFFIKDKHEFDCSGLSGFSVDISLGRGGWPFWRFDCLQGDLEGFAYYSGSKSFWLWSWICKGYIYNPAEGNLVRISSFCDEENILGELYKRSFLDGKNICPAVFFGDGEDVLKQENLVAGLYGSGASKIDLLVRLLESIPGVVFFNLVTPFSFTAVSLDSTKFLSELKGNFTAR